MSWPWQRALPLRLVGRDALQFQSDGDVLVLNGDVITNASTEQLTPSSSVQELIVKNGTEVVALFSTADGSLYLKGEWTTRVTDLADYSETPEFLIKNSAGAVVSLIDNDGDLRMRGRLYCTSSQQY